MGLDVYNTFYPKATERTFFSSVHGMFSKTDYMLGHKTHQFKKTEFISSIFLDHSGMKQEINYTEETGKFTDM